MGRNGFKKALSIMFIKHSYYDKNKANILLRTSGADTKTPVSPTPALWLNYQLQIIQGLMTVRLQRPSKDPKRSQCRDQGDGICHATVRIRVQVPRNVYRCQVSKHVHSDTCKHAHTDNNKHMNTHKHPKHMNTQEHHKHMNTHNGERRQASTHW